MKDYFYISSNRLVDSDVNITFREAFTSGEEEFDKWILSLKSLVRKNWKKYNLPPYEGSNTEESLVDDFRSFSKRKIDDVLCVDDLTHQENCLVNKTKTASSCNNFFPDIWRVVDTSVGCSMYQLFHDDKLANRLRSVLVRHYKNDGYYLFSTYAMKSDFSAAADLSQKNCIVRAKNGYDWIKEFTDKRSTQHKTFDFFLESTTREKNKRFIEGKATLSKREIEFLRQVDFIKDHHMKTMVFDEQDKQPFGKMPQKHLFYIRYFDNKEKIFPKGVRTFTTGVVVQTTNFSPSVAKYLYQRFTNHLKDQKRIVVFDPCSGFGGRLMGALTVASDRPLHYVGNDPNPYNFISDLNVSRYEYLGQFYKNNVKQKNHLTYEFFQDCAEELHKNKAFQKYKNKIDLVFTSPPYFNAEIYFGDKTDSSVRYPRYEDWRDKFLRRTLETCVSYLKKDGILIWNIADMNDHQTNKMMPLEADTIEILESLNMKYVDKLKYVLAKTTGSGRTGKITELPTHKNFVEINSSVRKYEPLLIFRKNK